MSLLLIKDLNDAKESLMRQTARITELEVAMEDFATCLDQRDEAVRTLQQRNLQLADLKISLDERDATIARQHRLIHDLAASLKDAVEGMQTNLYCADERRIIDEGLRQLAEVEAMG